MFGFLKGKILVNLEKNSFVSGEKIKGRTILKLKKPVSARRLKLVFFGERTVSHRSISDGRRTSSTERVYEFEQDLDIEKEYLNEEYDFEISIPKNLIGAKPENETLGMAMNIGSALIGGPSMTKWYVEAVLDVPKGFDVSKRVQVTITEQ